MSPLPNYTALQKLKDAIGTIPPRPHHGKLILTLSKLISKIHFQHVLTIGGWHQSGGIRSADGSLLNNDFESWLDEELSKFNYEYDKFSEHYKSSQLLVTRHIGKTHYFTASYGAAPEEFIQLEVEELHEVVHRHLMDSENPAPDWESLIDPENFVKLDEHPIDNPHYRFVRIVDVSDVLARQRSLHGENSPLARFMSEWTESRAANQSHFCKHWVITGLDDYNSAETESFTAYPLSTHKRSLKQFPWDVTKAGTGLANQIRNFDRAANYPGAWYFHYVSGKLVPETLGKALRHDIDNGYDYLAEKDLKLFQKLEDNPYRLSD